MDCSKRCGVLGRPSQADPTRAAAPPRRTSAAQSTSCPSREWPGGSDRGKNPCWKPHQSLAASVRTCGSACRRNLAEGARCSHPQGRREPPCARSKAWNKGSWSHKIGRIALRIAALGSGTFRLCVPRHRPPLVRPVHCADRCTARRHQRPARRPWWTTAQGTALRLCKPFWSNK